MSGPLTLLGLALLLGVPETGAAGPAGPEWGGFRGNNGTGVSSASIPEKLDPEANLRWRTEIPGGYSSPTVAGEHVYVTAADGTELQTISVSRSSGEIEWVKSVTFHGRRTGANSPAAPSPVTDGERIYSLFHDVGLIVYDAAGEEVWRHAVGKINIPHGLSSSPVLHDDTLVLQVDQDGGAYLIAFDKRTGDVRWRVEREAATHSYATPTIFTPESGPAEVLVSGSLELSSYSIDDGEKLWWTSGSSWQTNSLPVLDGDVCIVSAFMVPSNEFGIPNLFPTFEEALESFDEDGDGMISRDEWRHDALNQAWFVFDLDDDGKFDERDYKYLLGSKSATGGLYAVRAGGSGDVSDSHVVWTYDGRRGLPHVTSPLVVGRTLFLMKEGGLFTAVDVATGEVTKQGRVGQPDQYFASPVAGGERIVTASQSGQLAVITAEPEWDVLSVTELEEETWSTPAIAGSEVFVRTQKALYCFGS